jgi:ribosomal-protein-alanine N-acetyltransferase
LIVRDGREADLAAVVRIQADSPEAARWNPADYLAYDFLVAEVDGRVAGFVLSRTAGGETEILNLAVNPDLRLRGIGRALVEHVLERITGPVFLEVRQSNTAARKFYQVLGFQQVGARPEYYSDPRESAIVLKFHSC